MMTSRACIKFVLGLTLVAMLAGCATTNVARQAPVDQPAADAFVASKPASLQPLCRKLVDEGERNEVLNLMRLGLQAMQSGYLDEAEWFFDKALEGIEKVYANSEQAAAARSLWAEEGAKNFKGEPYERVMAYYYRGLLYLMNHDYQNARASFKAGMLQDAFVEEEQHRFDFALLSYLGGWCSQRLAGDTLAPEYFKDLAVLRPDIPLPAPADNILLVVETGKSPRKVADGVGHYQLKYRRGRNFSEEAVQFKLDDAPPVAAHKIEDIFWQASTRGGRQFDHILAGKAAFKKQTAAVGDAMGQLGTNTILASTVFQNSASELQGVGIGLSLAGAITQYASVRAKAAADIRYWETLPDAVHVYSLALPPGQHALELYYLDSSNQEDVSLRHRIDVSVEDNSPQLVWVPSRQTPGP